MSFYQVVETYQNTQIIKLYSNKEDGTYGDIYVSEQELLIDHPEAKVLHGFGVTYAKSGYSPDSSDDWYWTLDDAVRYVTELEECIESEMKNEKSEQKQEKKTCLTVGALREQLNRLHEANPENDNMSIEIPIQSDKRFVGGGGQYAPVSYAYPGFDWNRGKFLLVPKKNLVEGDER